MTMVMTRTTEDIKHIDGEPFNHVCALEVDAVQLNELEMFPENCELQGTISDP
jgi:hypothetical protein